MRPYGSPRTLASRRCRAVTLLAQGMSPREVARRVRAAVGSVYRWQQAWRQGGEAALAAKPVPGAPRKLTEAQREQLRRLLRQGARAAGFPNELWTVKRMAAVIQVHFGVRSHPAHVWKIVRGMGWSCQVPERRAIQRDEQVLTHWKRSQWPAIKKSPAPGRPSGLPG
jgi:transposase